MLVIAPPMAMTRILGNLWMDDLCTSLRCTLMMSLLQKYCIEYLLICHGIFRIIIAFTTIDVYIVDTLIAFLNQEDLVGLRIEDTVCSGL